MLQQLIQRRLDTSHLKCSSLIECSQQRSSISEQDTCVAFLLTTPLHPRSSTSIASQSSRKRPSGRTSSKVSAAGLGSNNGLSRIHQSVKVGSLECMRLDAITTYIEHAHLVGDSDSHNSFQEPFKQPYCYRCPSQILPGYSFVNLQV
jgi:hypothetical protein